MAPSFYEKERNRIKDLIKEPLLELIIQHLPHLQFTKSAREDVWEIIATKLNTYTYEQSLDAPEKKEEIPILSGIFVTEVFDSLMEKFTGKIPYIMNNGISYKATPQRDWYKARTDKLLCELYLTGGYDIELMAKLGKERLENKQRQLSMDSLSISENNSTTEKENGGDIPAPAASDSSRELQREKEKLLERRIALLEQKLEEKAAQLDKLTNENKRLLELNHDMLERNR